MSALEKVETPKRPRIYPNQYEWFSRLPDVGRMAYLTRVKHPKKPGELIYAHRYYFGHGRWSLGFLTHRDAMRFGRAAESELKEASFEERCNSGHVFEGLEYGACKRSVRRFQANPASLGHQKLLEATHKFIQADNWYRALLCASQTEAGPPSAIVEAQLKERDEAFARLVKVSEYSGGTNGNASC